VTMMLRQATKPSAPPMWAALGREAELGPAFGGKPLSYDAIRDSMHMLPLRMLPLHTPGLKRACLVKNVRLEPVIELFRDDAAGYGHITPDQLPRMYENGWAKEIAADMALINRLCLLYSYDVYSLRIELRRLGIDIETGSELSLSAQKQQELNSYMAEFTRPLLTYVYGQEARQCFHEEGDNPHAGMIKVLSLLSRPDQHQARRRLFDMAERLEISLMQIPDFIQDYGDLSLSLAYFRECHDRIIRDIQKFNEWMLEARESWYYQRDHNLLRRLDELSVTLNSLSTTLTSRFERFELRSQEFWANVSAHSFRRIRDLVMSHHVTIGGVLCGLSVKMGLWSHRFARNPGSPNKRIEFITTEILPGLNKILELDAAKVVLV
jgi:hypothetical protein